MSKRTIHLLVDDLEGGDADETVTFALDGIDYEIDLTKKNATRLRSILAKYVAAGTRIGRRGAPAGRRASDPRAGARRSPARVDRDQNRAIRDWAQSKGLPVSARGRISQEVVDRYQAEAGR